MILGNIMGKVSTREFNFLVKGNAKKFQYIQVMQDDKYVLGQILEIIRDSEKTVAYCNVLGYRENMMFKQLDTPLSPGIEVLEAEDDFIKDCLGLIKGDVYIGKLDKKDLKINLKINNLITKHVAILAKSGSGKCADPNTLITLDDGTRLRIGSLVDNELKHGFKKSKGIEFIENKNSNLKVISIDENNKVSSSKILTFMRRKSPKNMFLLCTRSGQEIKLTSEHPVPTINNEGIKWVSVCNLTDNNYVLLPKLNFKGTKQFIDLIDLWKDSNEVHIDEDDIINEIYLRIKEKKISINYLSKELNFSISTIRGWFKSSGIPLKQLIILSKILDIDFNIIKKQINFLRYKQFTFVSSIEVSEDFAKLLGYMLAEGHNTLRTILFTNYSKDIQKDYSELVKKVFKVKTSTISRENVLMIYNVFLARTLEKIGFTKSSWTKFIPEVIIKSEKSMIYAFLSSFIDCDGYLHKNSSSLDICLASKKLIEDIKFLFLRLGIVPKTFNKTVTGKKYSRLVVSGSLYFNILNKKINLLIKHKRSRLNYFSKLLNNPNINVIPNINETVAQIVHLLRMSYSMAGFKGIGRHINNKGNLSFYSLNFLLKRFNKRYEDLKKSIEEIQDLFVNMPKIDEKLALDFVSEAYNEGISFYKITDGSMISATTVRRMVRGITKPTNNVYALARNVANDQTNIDFNYFYNLKEISRKIEKLCGEVGYEKKELCKSIGRYKQFLHDHNIEGTIPPYSSLYSLSRKLFEISNDIECDLNKAMKKIEFLNQLANSNLFFDRIISVKKIESECAYVYDLETENHNFVANNIVVHNSYTVSVLLEELLERKVPIVVIDPHGEYSSLKYANDEDKDILINFNIKPKGFKNIQEYSPDTDLNSEARPLKLSNRNLSSNELIHLLPAKLSNSQLTSLYSALRNMVSFDFESLILELEKDENGAKWGLINVIDYVMKLNLFSYDYTKMQDLVKQDCCSIINLKGINQEIQEVVVYKLVNDLFLARKNNEIPPFFLVIEEAHNFIPERGYGEAKSSAILRQVFAEGRKFGLGACLITQRPSRVEKNALSQVNTQIILKITNPNDLRAVVNSMEGINSNIEKEIQNLSIGTAIISGVVDMPLFVNIRPRKSRHGGGAIKIFDELREVDFSREMLAVIETIDEKDLKLIGKRYKKVLIPCLMLKCFQKEDFNLLINLNTNEIIQNLEKGKGKNLSFTDLNLSGNQNKVMKIAFSLGNFKPAELFSKSGLQFSEIYDIVNTLTSKGVFIKENEWYKLNDRLNLFANLHNLGIYSKINFKEVKYDKKLSKLYENSDVVNFLSNFLDVKKEIECWLINYEKA